MRIFAGSFILYSVLVSPCRAVEVPPGVAIRDGALPLPAAAGADPIPIRAR